MLGQSEIFICSHSNPPTNAITGGMLRLSNAFLGSHDSNTTTRTRHAHSSNAMGRKKARAQMWRQGLRSAQKQYANAANAGEAIPGLPNHLVVAHILRSEYFDDPADLARLPAVSSAMRDTMAVIGLRLEELGEYQALKLGCLSAVKRRHRRGVLSGQELLCAAAAKGGHLEELKVLRADDWPWNENTCFRAAEWGHLGDERTARRVEGVAQERHAVGRADVHCGG